jgi:hypothetical protein
MKRLFVLCALAASLLPGFLPASAQPTILVEAEAFSQLGGWVVDPQFMDIMGSPYLLAHGLGTPVGDATTTVRVSRAGKYRVWVRTRDWVAPWRAPGAPGRFQVLIAGKPLETVFGDREADWHWQDGGRVDLQSPETRLALHDLTGFEGRCDAILFAADAALVPPNRDPEMAAFRHRALGQPDKPEECKTQDGGQFDFVVTGGGIAGTCAAVAAARLGLTVALVQDRPVLGGNNSSEVHVWLQGARNVPPYPRIGDIVAELEPSDRAQYGLETKGENYKDGKKLAVARAEKRLTLLLEHRVQTAETRDGRITAVIATDIISGRQRRLAGRWFADCTGDACVGALAGADFDLTLRGHMGQANLWTVADTGHPSPFPRCPWALDLSEKPFPGRNAKKPNPLKLGTWFWEAGFDHDPIRDLEYIRDWNFRAMYGAWDALKNVDKALPDYQLDWAAFITGKRESRRLLGDVVLSREDIANGKQYPDGCVPTGWKFDRHVPDERFEKGFEGDAFIGKGTVGEYTMPYWVPYRCLYSRNVENLFMAGRDISVTHEALGMVRVMRTCGCMGEIIGMAASLCQKHGTTPRGVYQEHLKELQAMMRRGVGNTAPAP